MNRTPHIPVVMYHSVGKAMPGWIWTNLITDLDLFEKQIALLAERGYRTITLDELHHRQSEEMDPESSEVVLTFDDGYLDNWVYAYPLMKRLGMKGTIYVNPDFIDPSEAPRPNLEDVWAGRMSENELEVTGFLNRSELRLLQESGVMTIASHSLSHTWYPTGPEVIDYHRPGLDTHWLAWNCRPDRKFAYLAERQSGFVPFGYPIHAHGRALGVRRYFPSDAIIEAATAWVADNQGPEAFSRKNWKKELDSRIAPHLSEGRPETDSEMIDRYRQEIFGSRSILEEIVGEPVLHFCWPGGAYNDTSWALAEEAGYRTICVAQRDRKRWESRDPRMVRRIGSGNSYAFRDGRYYTDDPVFLLLACELAMGRERSRWPYRLKKFMGAARTGFRPFKKSNKF